MKWEREHRAASYDLEATVQPALLEEWGLEVWIWEEDNTHPNPFKSKVARKLLHPFILSTCAHGLMYSYHTGHSKVIAC